VALAFGYFNSYTGLMLFPVFVAMKASLKTLAIKSIKIANFIKGKNQ
jgi:hypothetical protein